MLEMETIRKIRLALNKGMSLREAAKKFNKSRNTIRKILCSGTTRFVYQRKNQLYPALDSYIEPLEALLDANASLAPSKRRTMLALYEELQGHGYHRAATVLSGDMRASGMENGPHCPRCMYRSRLTEAKRFSLTGVVRKLR